MSNQFKQCYNPSRPFRPAPAVIQGPTIVRDAPLDGEVDPLLWVDDKPQVNGSLEPEEVTSK